MKRAQVFYDGQKNFLTNFFRVFSRQFGRKLKDETGRRSVMPIKTNANQRLMPNPGRTQRIISLKMDKKRFNIKKIISEIKG